MDITQLKYFLTTAETLNYTKAAQKLYISRQALRQALASMEKEFQTALFINRRNKLSLTAAGEYLYTAGTRVVEEFDGAVKGMTRFASEKVTLTIAVSKSLFPFMIPEMNQIIKRFRKRYPAICLDLQPMSNDEAIEAVTRGGADCSLVIQMPCERPGLRMESLAEYRGMVSYCEGHALEGRDTVGPEDLADMVCIGMGSMQETMRPFYEECRDKGLEICYQIVPSALDAFYRVAHEGVVAFDVDLPDVPDDFELGESSVLEGYSWELGLLCKEDSSLSGEQQLLVRFVREEYERMQEEKR
ncbi:MAG: LysR family transcriptional regulator [Lachnospiraceae bacterium]|jgi:DNA-binding transcriptional LysR family regulator|nr:LysR family transcriptional regulator [Lachnospiraceae bacterium]